jgi:hypothetical protein
VATWDRTARGGNEPEEGLAGGIDSPEVFIIGVDDWDDYLQSISDPPPTQALRDFLQTPPLWDEQTEG